MSSGSKSGDIILNPGANAAGGEGGNVILKGGATSGASSVGVVQLLGGSNTPGNDDDISNVGMMEINDININIKLSLTS